MQNQKLNKLPIGLVIAGSLSMLFSPFAAAQSDRRGALEEIVITGQKREQNVQDTPISVTAFSQNDIKDKNINNVEDLQFLTPALSIQEQGGLKFINIRGVGIAAVSPQTTSGVAYHIDGFFIPNEIAFSETYFDLDGIEVYRGPQGTFLGQNSTGGAIFVNTANPSFDESGFTLSATGGSYNYRKVEGAVDIPFSDTVAMRLAAITEGRDSYYDNIGPSGDDLDDVDRQGIRATLLFQPTETVEVNLKHEVTRSDSGGAFQKDLTDGIADPYTVAYGFRTDLNLDVDRTTLQVAWDLSDSLEFRSITGYQEVTELRYEDADNTVAQIHDRWIEISEETISQEFNLVSNLGGPLEFVVGAFYFEDESFFYSEDFIPGRMNTRANPPVLAEYYVSDGHPAHESWSVYGEMNYRISDAWEVIVGARFIDDTVSDIGGYTCSFCTAIDQLTIQGRQLFEEVNEKVKTGRIVLNYHTSDDNLLYGSLSRGFKSGGFNPGRYGFDPEYVDSIEIGHKTSFADGSVLLNSSAYLYDYDGYQLRIYDPNTGAGSSLLNTTTTEIYGFESELMFLSGSWQGNVGLGYGKSALEGLNLPDPRNPPPAGPILDLDGTELSYHPELTLNAGISYNHELSSGTLNTRLRLSYTDEQWTQIYQVYPTDYLDSFTLAHLDIEYQSEGDWWLKADISNLTDEEYISGKRINRAIRDVQFYGAPREYGIEFGWSTF